MEDGQNQKHESRIRQERKRLEGLVGLVQALSPSAYRLMIELSDPAISKEVFDRKIAEFNAPRGSRPTANARARILDVHDLITYGATIVQKMPEARTLQVVIYIDNEDGSRKIFLDGHATA